MDSDSSKLVDIGTQQEFNTLHLSRKFYPLLPEGPQEQFQATLAFREGCALYHLFKEKYNRKPKLLSYVTPYTFDRDYIGVYTVLSFEWRESKRFIRTSFGRKFIVTLARLTNLEACEAVANLSDNKVFKS